MKKILLTSALLTFSIFSSFALASNSMSSTINLGGSNVPPTQTYNFDLTTLLSNVTYSLNCNIKDPNNANNKVVVRIGGEDASLYTINSGYSADGYIQGELTQVDNTAHVTNVYSNDTFYITNTDFDDTIIINCTASASHF